MKLRDLLNRKRLPLLPLPVRRPAFPSPPTSRWLPRWSHNLTHPSVPATVNAATKSEARALLKRAAGLRRLPVGIELRMVGGAEVAS